MKNKKFNLTILGILLICLSIVNNSNSLSSILLTNGDLNDDNETNLKIADIPQNETIEFDAHTDVFTENNIGVSPIHVSNVSYLRLGYWDNNTREIYIRFNITSIENIASMKLRFIQEGNSALQITDYEIKSSLVDNNWLVNATDMWWDSRPAELGYSVVDTMTVGGWAHEPVEIIFDITELKDGLSDTLFSIFLEPNNLSQIANFFYQPASSENANTSIHPKLIVEYGYSHPKIYINGNNQFTAENGVSNPSALGTEGDPFIIENWIIDAGGSGSAIFIENTNKYFRIENCTVYNSGNTIDVDSNVKFDNVTNGQISWNNLSNTGSGIYSILLINSHDNIIDHNNATNNNNIGIVLISSNNNTIIYNNASNNGQHGFYSKYSDFNNFSSNYFQFNTLDGFLIEWSCDNNTIFNNTITNNPGNGIRIKYRSSSTNQFNKFFRNYISNNQGTGIKLESSGNDNLIYFNIVEGNNIQAEDNGINNQWDNGTIGNYWGDYTGTDINDDGIGDSEYSISGSASSKDYYPLWDDGSETYLWSDPELISIDSTDTSEYPDIAVDYNGNVHVVWNDNTNDYLGSGTDVDVFYKCWNATSEIWNIIEVVSNESSINSEQPKIDVDQNGNVYVVWFENSDLAGSGGDQDVFYKILNVTTNNWTLTGVVSTESNGASNEPDIAIDNAGNVHVVWHDYTNDYLGSGADEDIFYKRWNATSKTWTITEVVSIGSTGASRVTEIAVDSNGNAHVTWSDLGNDYISSGSDMDIFYRRWNATSKTWTTVELASNPSNGQSYNPEIATDLFGNAHIIWQDFTYDNIYSKNWNATSKIWSSTLIVSSTSNVEHPFISTDIYGNVHIVWHNGSSSPGDDEVIYKRWNAFNDTWTNLKIVSTTGANIDCDKAPAITSDINGGTHIVWPDRTLGDNDIYYRKLIIDYGAPEIIINDPIDKEYINEIPKINVSAYDPNFDQLWYKVGDTNIDLINNTEQLLESSIWNALDEGAFIIYIYASDTRDNVNVKNVTLYKDTESPAITFVYQAVDAPNYISKTTILNFTSVDAGSGVFNITYKIDSGTWMLHSNSFNLDGLSHGNHTIYYYATDNLGNVENINQSIVFLDLLAPDIIFEFSPFYLTTLKPQYTQNYLQINCSVVDNTTISWVYLNENSTGIFINRSMSLINGNYTYNIDLSPLIWNDTISFSFYANDSASNIRHFNNEGQDFLISMDNFYRSPILIAGKNDFTFENGVKNPWASGTMEDPYIIENWIIDALGGEFGILIQNSDVYFRIENCTVFNSGNTIYTDALIKLDNVTNGRISENNLSNTGVGIYSIFLIDSDNNTVVLNNATHNDNVGILLWRSDNNTIAYNNASNNGQDGIYLETSSFNIIKFNNFAQNSWNGIILRANSHNNTIFWNKVSDSGTVGISIRTDIGPCNNNLIYYNWVINNNVQSQDDGTNNQWDNGIIGNYWGDYESNYPNAWSDGFFWNTPYTIFGSANSFDNHPVDNFLEEDPFYFNFIKTQMTYSKNGVYEFNCTWTDDDNEISEVYLKFNGTYFLVLTNFSGEFSYSFFDLPANEGGYEYQWLAKDQNNAWNATPIKSFILYRSNILPLSLLFNGIEGDAIHYSHQDVNITIVNQTVFSGNFELYVNSILVDQGFSSQLTYIFRFSTIGIYNITSKIYNQNYTGILTYWLTIEDIISPDIIFAISPSYLNTTTPQYNQTGLQINITVQDDTSIIWVYLCENSTGVFMNRSMTYVNGKYTFNLDISSLNWGTTIMFSFYAQDSGGNIKWENNGGLNYSIQIYDFQDPTTTLDFQNVENPNFVSNLTLFTLNSNDWEIYASGIYIISYRIDSGSWILYTNPFSLVGYSHGTHTIYYYATDNAGNTELINQEIIFLDIQSPNIIFAISPSYLNTTTPQYNQTGLQISCTVQDDTSIIWVYLYENSTGTFINHLMLYVNGKYTVNLDISSLTWTNAIIFYFAAIDSAGNFELNNNGGLNYLIPIYDFQETITSLDFNLSFDPNFVDISTLFTLLAEDNVSMGSSGVKMIIYKIDNGDWKIYSVTFNLSEYSEGIHIIYYYATDYAGNVETTNQISIYLITQDSDLDGDGLIYSEELKNNTDPFDSDTDNDNMPDGWEVFNGLDPLIDDSGGDLDSDTLFNLDEYTNGTDPNNSDTDDDGLSDGQEVNTYSTDPNNSDSDDDGLSDGQEVNTYSTDPNSSDSDDDGLSDGQEINTYSTDPNSSDSDNDGLSDGQEVNTYSTDPNNSDTDGDGYSDYDEIFISRTDPNNALSSPTMNITIIIIVLSAITISSYVGVKKWKSIHRRRVEDEVITRISKDKIKVFDHYAINERLQKVKSKLDFENIVKESNVNGQYILNGAIFVKAIGIKKFAILIKEIVKKIYVQNLSKPEEVNLIKINIKNLEQDKRLLELIEKLKG